MTETSAPPATNENPDPAIPPPLDCLTFSTALLFLNEGRRLARDGWNGKGMWIALQRGYPDGIPINANTAQATGLAEGAVCRFRPYLMMFTAQGDFVPWVASQSDLLAEDWAVVL